MNTLTYQDLNNFYIEETKGYNFGTSVGGNTDKGKANMAPNGSTTIGLTHTGQEKEQITRATIGLGNITIANNNDISNLNRDVDNSQEITKDIITGALDASVTIDNRLFTSDGRSEIANNFVNLPSNLVRAGAGATGSALNILESAYNGAKNLSVSDAIDSWKANQSNLVAGQSMSSNDKSREVINNLSEGKSQQDIENALNSGFAKYDDNGNLINTITLYNDENDKNKGTHQNSTGNNYINSAYTDMTNTSDVLKVASHENAHNYTKNEDLANASQKYTAFSYFMGNVASGDSVNKNGTATNTSWNNTYGNTQQMSYNTSLVRNIDPNDRSNFRNENGVTVKDMLNSDEIKNQTKERIIIAKPTYQSESGGKFNADNRENSANDPGGMSYGVGQIETAGETMIKFANYLKENANFLNEKDGYNKNMYEEFLKAGGVEGAKAGTQEFLDFWKEASQYSDFAEHQVNFLHENNYMPTQQVFINYGYDVDNYSIGAKSLIYSTGVQYGDKNTTKLLNMDLNEAQRNNTVQIMDGTDSQTFKDSLTETKQKFVTRSFPSYINGNPKKPNSEAKKNEIINNLNRRWENEKNKANKIDNK